MENFRHGPLTPRSSAPATNAYSIINHGFHTYFYFQRLRYKDSSLSLGRLFQERSVRAPTASVCRPGTARRPVPPLLGHPFITSTSNIPLLPRPFFVSLPHLSPFRHGTRATLTCSSILAELSELFMGTEQNEVLGVFHGTSFVMWL